MIKYICLVSATLLSFNYSCKISLLLIRIEITIRIILVINSLWALTNKILTTLIEVYTPELVLNCLDILRFQDFINLISNTKLTR